jgi:hypothetical protein
VTRLFDPAEHEPLAGARWDEGAARAAIGALAAEAEVEGDATLWTGAAGVRWGIGFLARDGWAGLRRDDEQPAGELPEPGLMLGQSGVVLAAWSASPSRDRENRLLDLVRGNARNPQHELFLGGTGTLLAALHLLEATGEERWRRAAAETADYLWGEWRPDPEHGCRLWIQYRRGRLLRSIGAGHGFASNAHALLRAFELLGDDRLGELRDESLRTASTLALHEDGLANWETSADAYWARDFPIRVQWCHGAPGLVTSLACLPRSVEADALLEAAGELVWEAGPLRKGYGLCHGTAGNGCAFLALAARTGDECWLERAHAFAMHALQQREAGERRPGLWNGDLGLAFYLRSCLEGWRGMPLIDVL